MKQNNNKQLIKYKENIFLKIKKFFKMLFFRKETDNIEYEDVVINANNSDFKDSIRIKLDSDVQRLNELKRKLDNNSISIDEIEIDDIDSLISLYNEETKIINQNIEIKKNRIKMMLKELKSV